MLYINIDSTSSYITLLPGTEQNNIKYYLMTWKLVDAKSDNYIVRITPTPADGPSERSTKVAATYLSLYDNVEYNVTISLGNSSLYIGRSFKIGKILCDFIHSLNYNY